MYHRLSRPQPSVRLGLLAVVVAAFSMSTPALGATQKTAKAAKSTTVQPAPTTVAPPASTAPPRTSAPKREAKDPFRIVTTFVIRNWTPELQGFWQVEFGNAELFMRPQPDGKPTPWVAQSLTQVDPKTWQIKLRPNVTFQNGRPFDADAAVAVVKRQFELGGSAKANFPGATVSKVDAATVNIVTASPQVNVPNLLANEDVIPIYDAATVASIGNTNASLVTAGIYTGPYSGMSLDGTQMVLKRYDGYWQGKPSFPGVSVKFVADPQARLLAVQNNEADLMLYPPTDFKRILKGRSDVAFVAAKASISQLQFAPNLREFPTNDRDVRRSINLAIDYESFANDVMDGAYEVSKGMWPPLVPFASNRLKTDVARAKRILDDAGWRVGDGDIRFKNGKPLKITVLTYPQQPDSRTAAIAVQAMLKKVGVDMEINQVDDINAAMDKKTGWNAGIVFNGAVGFTVEPVSVMRSTMATTGPRNRQGIDDVEIDKYAEQLVGTFDQKERNRLLGRVEDLVIFDEAYMTFLGSRFPGTVVRSAFKNFEPNFANLWVGYETQPGA